MYRDIVDPNFTWNNFTKEEQSKILDSDKSNNFPDTKKLESLYPEVKNIKNSIKKCLIKVLILLRNLQKNHNNV